MTARQKVLVGIGTLIVLVNTAMIAERIINPATASIFGTGQHDHPHDHDYADQYHSHYDYADQYHSH